MNKRKCTKVIVISSDSDPSSDEDGFFGPDYKPVTNKKSRRSQSAPATPTVFKMRDVVVVNDPMKVFNENTTAQWVQSAQEITHIGEFNQALAM